MDKEKEKSSGTAKVVAVVFGIIDIVLIVMLMFSFLMKPIKGESLKENIPVDFTENANNYWQSNSVKEYRSTASVDYTSDIAPTAIPTTAPDTTSAQENVGNEDGLYVGFVFPDSNTIVLTDSQIQKKVTDQKTSRRAINEIYARHGYAFTKQENIDYFNKYDWYKNMPKESDMNKVSSQFSTIEKGNVEKLQAYENSMGWN